MCRFWLPLAALAGAVAVAPSGAGEHDPKQAGALFKARCASCHFVPDPSVTTDLAWLDQVNRTS